ncbi:MAG: YitT family protein [Desulfobulbaceae bacterium]|nr:YitT family protein [Desulfobulbaceae bacterium]
MMDNKRKYQTLFVSPQQLLLDVVLIITGSVLCATAINGILIPQDFVTGGLTGISLIIHNFVPKLDVSTIYLLFNIPLFVLAWMAVGRRFFFYSILGTLCLTSSIAIVHVSIVLDDKILNALLAGLILGTGAGLVLKSSGSQGGMDILSVMLLKRFSIGIGNTILTVNAFVLVILSLSYSIEAVLYTLIVIFVSSKMINLVVTGLSQRKAVFIISTHWQTISREILKDIRRGVTIIKGEGGYTGSEEHILYTVITLTELGDLKRLINDIDPAAFVVISDTLEVVNYRIGNQPHW